MVDVWRWTKSNCWLLFAPLILPIAVQAAHPNVLLILTDDQGYEDVAAFGNRELQTPNLDALAQAGVRVTQFYAQPTCGPSRAALMTGNSPVRIGMDFDPLPGSKRGLPSEPTTLGEMFRSAGYRTGYFGKWHLGDRREHLPLSHGFDRYFGVPYSSDMWPFHHNMPVAKGSTTDERLLAAITRVNKTGAAHRGMTFTDPGIFPPLPLIEDNATLETNPDQRFLTERFTNQAIGFIEADDRPFFAMVAYTSPHVPLFAHPEFSGRSKRGLYGDVIEEIDARVGEIFQVLKKDNKLQDTIVIFLSDNGPWLEYGEDAGSAKPLKGGKATIWEGGWRVPAIFSWPGHLQPAIINNVMSMMDVLPTLAQMSGVEPPGRFPLDGKSQWQALRGQTVNPDAEFLYFADFSGEGATSTVGKQYLAFRKGDWKLHLYTHRSRWLGWWYGYEVRPIALYNLTLDPGETTDRQVDHAEQLEEMSELATERLNMLCAELPPWVGNTCD